jgi:WD40 repeat protein
VLLGCIGAFFFGNGGLYCSTLDSTYRLTPCLRTLPVESPIREAAFSPDSRLLAITTPESVHVWDVNTGTIIQTIATTSIGTPHQSVFSPDGTRLATTGSNGTQVIDRMPSQLIYTIPDIDTAGAVITFSPDGRFLARSGLANIRLYNADDGTLFQTITVQEGLDRQALRFTPDSQHVLLWAGGETRLWEIQRQQIVWTTPGFADASLDATLLLLPLARDTAVLKLAASHDQYIEYQRTRGGCRNRGSVLLPTNNHILSINHTDDTLFIPSLSPTMCVWRLSDGKITWQSQAQGDCVAAASNGQIAAVCVGAGIQLWDIPPEWYD